MTAPTPDLAADIERVLRAAPHMPLSFEERDCFMRILAAARRTAEAEEERHYVLRDWNALVKAIGSPTHGAAIGFGASLKAEVESLRSRLAQAQEEYLSALTSAQNEAEFQTERAEAAERQLAETRAALRKYGRHRAYCPRHQGDSPCICGLRVALGEEVSRG